MSTPSSSQRRAWRRALQFLAGWAGWVYLTSATLWLLVVVLARPADFARDFRILGLLLNIVGATIALSPRFLRGYALINERLDTLLARWGLAFLAIGFFQQLVGNVIG